jgi:hypothetical protein
MRVSKVNVSKVLRDQEAIVAQLRKRQGFYKEPNFY